MTLTISAESMAVVKEVAKSLNHTAVPDYVLKYGVFPPPLIHFGQRLISECSPFGFT